MAYTRIKHLGHFLKINSLAVGLCVGRLIVRTVGLLPCLDSDWLFFWTELRLEPCVPLTVSSYSFKIRVLTVILQVCKTKYNALYFSFANIFTKLLQKFWRYKIFNFYWFSFELWKSDSHKTCKTETSGREIVLNCLN